MLQMGEEETCRHYLSLHTKFTAFRRVLRKLWPVEEIWWKLSNVGYGGVIRGGKDQGDARAEWGERFHP